MVDDVFHIGVAGKDRVVQEIMHGFMLCSGGVNISTSFFRDVD